MIVDLEVETPTEFLLDLMHTSKAGAQQILANMILVVADTHHEDVNVFIHELEKIATKLDFEIEAKVKEEMNEA